MPSATHKTQPDPGPARRSAMDQWTASTLQYFLEACRHWRDDPGRSLELVRYVLEGWAHAVNVALDPAFAPHRGSELHRKMLGDVFPFAKMHLPKDLQVFVDHAKKLGDLHHHNQ